MRLLTALVALCVFTGAGAARADEFSPTQRQEVVKTLREALVRDPSILREALIALQKDDVARREKATSDVIGMLGPRLADPADPVEGNPLGDVTVVEFFDTRCPYCRRMPPVLAELLRTDPNVKLVMKDLPILGPTSQLESRALLAAQMQGGYFKMQDAVMSTAAPSTRDTLRDTAERIGLDGNRMLRDMDDPAIKTRLQNNLDVGARLGIEGTPAFIVGTRMIGGAAELPELRRAIADARTGK